MLASHCSMRRGIRISFALAAAASLSSATTFAQWTIHPFSVQRGGVGTATIGTRVIFAGGGSTSGPTTAVDIFDDSTGLWTTSTLPAPAFGLDGDSVGPYAMFATSGFFSDVVFIFDTTTDTWSTAALSEPRGSVKVVTSGTKVIFAGGDVFSTGSDVVDIYDHSVGPPSDPAAWSTTQLSDMRAVAAGFRVGNAAVFAGGDNALASSFRMDYFDEVTGTRFSEVLPSGRLPKSGTGLGSRAILSTFGGIPSGVFLWRFETFDFATGESTIGPEHPPAPGLGAATLGDRAIFAGNPGDMGGGFPSPPGVWIYNSITDLWTTAQLPTIDAGFSTATVGTKAFFAGGFLGGNVLIYDDAIGTSYCAPAVPNSTGVPATLRAQGAPAEAVDGSTRLNVKDLPVGSVGYVIASQSQGFSMPASSQGPLCLGGTIARFNRPEQLIDGPEGSVSFSHADVPGIGQASIQPGDTWYFQCWYRDANPASTSNFTDALSISYQ